MGDSVPLRIAGALHHLASTGLCALLAAVYPPAEVGDDALWRGILAALDGHAEVIDSYLATPPQTNEVMRSAALLPGLLRIAERTRLPLAIYELGVSAGLNLVLDRYRYRFGDAEWGDADSPVLIAPQWSGASPPVTASLKIASRCGVDLHPVNLRDAAARARLRSYVWVDQAARLQRLDAAMQLWLDDAPEIAAGDAAQWLEQSTITEAVPGRTRVLMHSVAWSYFPQGVQRRITALMESAGAAASVDAPLAWLSFELSKEGADLRLRLWPDGSDRLLASGHPHGNTIHWLESGGSA